MGLTVNGSPTSADMINTAIAINYLKDSQTAATVLRTYDFTVAINHTNSDSTLVPSDGSTPQIDWDPNLAHQVYSADYKAGIQSPAMALAHEIAHVLGMDENQATAFETQIALELGEPTRGNYQLVTQEKIYVENSTEHSANGQFTQKNLDGTHTVSGTYNGTLAEKTAPAMGWGAGALGGGGGGIISVGNILILPSTAPGKHDKSHWQNVPYQQEMGKESHSFSHNHQHGDGANVLANTPADSTNSFHTDEHAIIVGQPHQPVHGHF